MLGLLEKNLNEINKLIEAESTQNSQLKMPRVIAVSKKQPIEKIRSLYSLGVRDFAENYLQEVLSKQESLSDLDIRWHFIGQVQSKKIKELVGAFDLIHSVSRMSEVEKMSVLAQEKNIKQKFLVQVNIAEEDSKQGVNPKDLVEFVMEAKDKTSLLLSGLMVFPPLSSSEEESLKWFKKGSQLFESCQKACGPEFCHLSMGTSHDFHLAYRMGATDLRIGERLIGPRNS